MIQEKIKRVLKDGQGIFRMKPIFVPRRSSKAGRWLRLHNDAARRGVRICNHSTTEPLVLLKHFPVTEDTP